jgi:hypothetical protein
VLRPDAVTVLHDFAGPERRAAATAAAEREGAARVASAERALARIQAGRSSTSTASSSVRSAVGDPASRQTRGAAGRFVDAARTAARASAAIESWKVEDGAKRLDAGALAALASVNSTLNGVAREVAKITTEAREDRVEREEQARARERREAEADRKVVRPLRRQVEEIERTLPANVNWFSDIEIRLRDEIAKLGSRAPRAQATLEALVDRVVQARSLDEVRRSRRGKGVSRRAGPARTP